MVASFPPFGQCLSIDVRVGVSRREGMGVDGEDGGVKDESVGFLVLFVGSKKEAPSC